VLNQFRGARESMIPHGRPDAQAEEDSQASTGAAMDWVALLGQDAQVAARPGRKSIL